MTEPAVLVILAKDSILDSVKKVLGFDASYTAFDLDLTMHINSVLGTLHQLGVGPIGGFSIVDRTATWADFIGQVPNLESVKTYVCLKVRLIFDPPATSFAIAAFEKQTQELEWRLMVVVDPPPVAAVPIIMEGGYPYGW
jgi:hypothetical protein